MTAAPILIVGAGPTGMTAALDLAYYGVASILVDEDHLVNEGSRAIAYSAATLATWEKLGAAKAMLAKGIAWSVRHTYFRDREVYTQNFTLEGEGYLPRYFNLQQYYVERYLLDCIEANPLIEIHWEHKVIGIHQEANQVSLRMSTPTGEVEYSAPYVLACDGARSSMRKLLNLPFPGITHKDHFLIADIRADLHSPPEPRFYYDHPTNPRQTVLIHPQPDGIWRIDWQVGPAVDIQTERDPQRMDQRIRPLIGNIPYEIVWLTDYRFHQRILERFRCERVFFLGDAAHLVAPFGARGLNSAVADVENLAWKLALVLRSIAPEDLLETYQTERWPAQMHNQNVTNRTMLFMAPPNRWRRILRNIILRLTPIYPPARHWVDSGKMVIPYTYQDSPLNTPDDLPPDAWRGAPELGSQVQDLPCTYSVNGRNEPIFFRNLIGPGFIGLFFTETVEDSQGLVQQADRFSQTGIRVQTWPVLSRQPSQTVSTPILIDENGGLQQAFMARPGTFYLIRPDGHITGRRRSLPFDLSEMLCKACDLKSQPVERLEIT